MKKCGVLGKLGFALAAIGMFTCAAAADVSEIKRPGQWDASAIYLWPGPTDIADAPDGVRLATIPSPDKQFVLRVRDNKLHVAGRDGVSISKSIVIEDLAEVSWAPDSAEFAVTESDGGWVGTWTATVYAVNSGAVRKYDVSPLIAARFQTRPQGCKEVPNVAAVSWLGPDRLLIVAEAPPHSSCSDMGTVRGYELSVEAGRIQREYSSEELRSRFGSRLGPRLRRS